MCRLCSIRHVDEDFLWRLQRIEILLALMLEAFKDAPHIRHHLLLALSIILTLSKSVQCHHILVAIPMSGRFPSIAVLSWCQ